MLKSLKISSEVHQIAKDRSRLVGLKIQRFVEMAIERFSPSIIDHRRPRKPRSKAG
jgi:hypothetical protein